MSVYSEKILGELLRMTNLRLAVIDGSGYVKLASDGFAKSFPDLLEPGEFEGTFIRFSCFDKPDDFKQMLSKPIPPGNMVTIQVKTLCSGLNLRLEVTISPLVFPDIEPLFLTEWSPVGEAGDIQLALLESEKRYRTLQENLPVGIYRADEDGILRTANRALISMMGYDSFQDLQEVPLENVWINPDRRTELIEKLRKEGSVIGFQVLLHRKDGSELIGSFDARGTFNPNGRLLYFDTIVSDITMQVRDKKELERMARTDSLTGLLNRQHLMERIYSEVSRSTRYGHPTGLALIDLDEFKSINDKHGHLAGDSVLVSFASKIGNALRDVDFAGRYGGEEFCVVLPETDLLGAAELAERIRKSMESSTFKLENGEELKVTCSIGVASLMGEYSASDLIFSADNALYEAKRNGRNRVILSGEENQGEETQ